MVGEVVKLRTHGLTYREIAEKLDIDIKQAHRWAMYAKEKLSTQVRIVQIKRK